LFKTTDVEFFRIVNYIRINFGINLINKRTFIEKRLEPILTQYNFKSFEELMITVENDKSNEFNNKLIGALVTNHTYFMREELHFELLKQVIFPKLFKMDDTIRIWSAAASSGQEAYSIEMIFRDLQDEMQKRCNIEVLGTDISIEMLQIAVNGEYTKEEMEMVSDEWKRKYFTKKINEDYRINDVIKKDVVFKKLNLMSPLEFEKKFHIIFLRNILSYFNQQTVNEVVEKVANNLMIGGYLFIGTTETINICSDKLLFIQPSVYRRI
jgi:chemotaxis protein methyltransferase CheR